MKVGCMWDRWLLRGVIFVGLTIFAAADTDPSEIGESYDSEELVNILDPLLKTFDFNGDGYLDYSEYVHAQR